VGSVFLTYFATFVIFRFVAQRFALC